MSDLTQRITGIFLALLILALGLLPVSGAAFYGEFTEAQA